MIESKIFGSNLRMIFPASGGVENVSYFYLFVILLIKELVLKTCT